MGKKRAIKKPPTATGAQRLNKVLAAAGLGSRRQVEELIVSGRVEIDHEIVTNLASRVDPTQVTIKVDGTVLKRYRPVYYALNKPPGVLSTNKDPSGRIRVVDLVPDKHRVFSVGRLDRNSEGLMLMTNDGELAQRLAHPRFGVQKTYFAVVQGQISEEQLTKLRKGVYLAEGVARIDGATIRKVRKGCTELEIVLSEGKNREIRRILALAGHKVVTLRRLAIGPLRLGNLASGESRTLTQTEVASLYAASDPKSAAKRRRTVRRADVAGKPRVDDTDDVFPLFDQSVEDNDEILGDLSGSPAPGCVLDYEDDNTAGQSTQHRRIQPTSPGKQGASGRRSATSRSGSNRQRPPRDANRKIGGKAARGKRSASSSSRPKKFRHPKSAKVMGPNAGAKRGNRRGKR